MTGIKARLYTPFPNISLENLVPGDHFYRHLDRALDLSFVRDLVSDCYAEGGRPSIDPVVFFKLHLVMFFEGLRAERQLLRIAAIAHCTPARYTVQPGQTLRRPSGQARGDGKRNGKINKETKR